MTLLSIFFHKFKEAADKGNPAVHPDNIDGGIKVDYWFWGASKKIAHAMDKNQLKFKQGAKVAKADCSAHSDIKQAANRLLGRPVHKCECESCKKESGRVISSPKHEPIDSGEAASATAFPAHMRQSKIKIIANKIREAAGNASQSPTKFRVVLIEEGLGNFNDAFYYTKDALDSAVDIFNGAKIYADHPSLIEEQSRPERSTRDILGHFENTSVEIADDGCAQLCGDVDIVPGQDTEWARALMTRAIENIAKFPDKPFIGLSINAAGESEKIEIDQIIKQAPEGAKPKLAEAKDKGIELVKVVRQINQAVSCDLVTEAGAGGKILKIIEGEKSDGKKENSKAKRA